MPNPRTNLPPTYTKKALAWFLRVNMLGVHVNVVYILPYPLAKVPTKPPTIMRTHPVAMGTLRPHQSAM